MSAERNLAAVRKLYDAYEAGGLDAGYAVLDEVMDPEAVEAARELVSAEA